MAFIDSGIHKNILQKQTNSPEVTKSDMAKAKPPSKHSRAARRAASPSLDLDKSLTSLPRAENTPMQRESILADRANAGVTKKQAKPRNRSRTQRLRQQKGQDRAEAVLDQLEIKVAKSKNRAKTVKNRRAEWSDLNGKAAKFDALAEADNGDDDAMVDAPVTSSKPKANPAHVTQNVTVEEHAPIDEDDEID
ncbi:Alb1 domain-containing protein [Aspergillus undulatus]|uniref:Alb1 domain-containing protein n=1 Tax=Aspergillus undulatus TaxID=1810928 RepID=UPI003CCD2399